MPKHNVKPMRVEPTEDGQRLRIVWKDGHTSEYVPRDIRLACPCAECVDEYTGQPLLDPATVPEGIMPVKIEYVGGYALGFTWPDGHDSGIFPYDLLRRICPCQECVARRESGDEPEDRARFLRMARDDDGVARPSGGAPASGDEATNGSGEAD